MNVDGKSSYILNPSNSMGLKNRQGLIVLFLGRVHNPVFNYGEFAIIAKLSQTQRLKLLNRIAIMQMESLFGHKEIKQCLKKRE